MLINKMNSALEYNIVKTIAAFLNHRGGNLLIGVKDSGEIAGLQPDYATLKCQNRDGFQQFLMTLFKAKIDGSVCPLIHVSFREIDGKDVCRVIVEPSNHPVYVRADGTARYFLRMGNASKELDIQEALQHISQRWPSR